MQQDIAYLLSLREKKATYKRIPANVYIDTLLCFCFDTSIRLGFVAQSREGAQNLKVFPCTFQLHLNRDFCQAEPHASGMLPMKNSPTVDVNVPRGKRQLTNFNRGKQ